MIGHKVELELRRGNTVDDRAGSKTTTWEGKRRLSGVLVTLTGDEMLDADKLAVIQTHKFYIDFPVGETITAKDRLYYGARVFEIKHAHNIGANRSKQLKIVLKEET
jgi:SPP1 family predicted phage head-tail adaptor